MQEKKRQARKQTPLFSPSRLPKHIEIERRTLPCMQAKVHSAGSGCGIRQNSKKMRESFRKTSLKNLFFWVGETQKHDEITKNVGEFPFLPPSKSCLRVKTHRKWRVYIAFSRVGRERTERERLLKADGGATPNFL